MNKINLAGSWQMYLGKFSPDTVPYDEIRLPSTLSMEKKTPYHIEDITNHLTDPYEYRGSAVFVREIVLETLPDRIFLTLERTRMTKIYVDGVLAGEGDTLCGVQRFELTEYVKNPSFTLAVEVSNDRYPAGGGHMASPDTQTNWLGIVGEMSLILCDGLRIHGLRVTGDIENRTALVTFKLDAAEKGMAKIMFRTSCGDCIPADAQIRVPVNAGENSVSYTVALGKDAPLWSEHTPNVFELTVTAETETSSDEYKTTFGLRKFAAEGSKFTINGDITFLRGKHDGLTFPMTGYAPMDVDEWIRVLEIAKSYGINHYRFHTCTPPHAAFEAADRLGIYMAPEIPVWGALVSPANPNYNETSQNWIVAEGYRIIEEFGNHPSFVMFALGNELRGDRDVINGIVSAYKAFDGRRLYTQGSNNFFWDPLVLPCDDYFSGVRMSAHRHFRASFAMCDSPQGHIQTMRPNSSFTYDATLHPTEDYLYKDENPHNNPSVPVVSHEIGQFVTYPDYENELPRYENSLLKPRNFEIFRERLADAGLGDREKSIHKTSGALAVANYRDELETALRSESMAGFQILDLQDFDGQGTATVGILDAFMEPKGLISPEDWRKFCSDAVILCELDKFVFTAGEEIGVNFTAAIYREVPGNCTLHWSFGEYSGEIEDIRLTRGVNRIGSVKIPAEAERPCSKTLYVTLTGEAFEITNDYRVWLYPAAERRTSDTVTVAHTFDELKNAVDAGEKVLYLPERADNPNSVKGDYATDFWCYAMFRRPEEKNEPAGTLGLNIDLSHPVFGNLPVDAHTTPVWFEPVVNSRPTILDGTGIVPAAAVNDNFDHDRNHNLGLLYEMTCGKAKIFVCAAPLDRLNTPEEDIASVWLYNEIVRYMESERFAPSADITADTLGKLYLG